MFDGAINLIKSIDYKEVAIAALSATASAIVGYFTGWNPILMGATYGAADGFVRGIVNNQSKEEIIANTIIGGAIGGVFAYGIGALGNVAQGVLPKIAGTTFGKAVNSGITKVVNSKVGSALNSITNSFIGRNILESTVETSISTISSKVRGEEVSFGQVATNFVSNLLTNSIFDYGSTLNKNKVKASDTNVEVDIKQNENFDFPKNSNQLGTKEVWDKIKATQPNYEGTVLPKSFEISLNNQKMWVHPNATKHINEAIININNYTEIDKDYYTQLLLADYYEALNDATKNGIKYESIISSGSWEFIFSEPRKDGLLSVVKHGQFNGWEK